MAASLAVLLCISAVDQGDQDPDFLAPFLGLTLLDAEDLARDAADPLVARQVEPPPSTSSSAPFWAELVPSLSLEIVHREARQVSGNDVFGAASGTLLLAEASFGLPEERDGRSSRERGEPGAAGLRLAALGPPEETPSQADLPSIGEVRRAVEQAALVHLEDLDGWRTRARASAWLPEVGASYQRNVGEIDTLGVQSNLGIDSHNVEDVTRYGVRLTWQLNQLVFSREEVAAARAAVEVQRDRQELMAHVTELYFEWVRLKGRLAKGEGDVEVGVLRLAEVAAKIDALTAGFFSRRLRERGRP